VIHDLKTWPQYFARLVDGSKTFEVRKDDRGYQTGDTLVLREFDPNRCRLGSACAGGPDGPNRCPGHTGRLLRFQVGFIYRQGVGLDCGDHIVMSLIPATETAEEDQ